LQKGDILKLLTLFLFFSLSLWPADIDTKLYEGNNTLAYYKEVSKLIDKEEPQDQADIERIATERLILEKLSNLLSFQPKTDPLPDSLLSDKQPISMESYLSYLNALTDTYQTIQTLRDQQESMQLKRKSLSQSISNITSEDKKNLLLYQLQYAYYKLKDKNQALSIQTYEKIVKEGEKHFKKNLKQVNFDIQLLKQQLAASDKKILTVEDEAIALNLAKERELIHRETISKTLRTNLLKNESTRIEVYTTKIDQTILLSLAYLQMEENQKTLDIFNETRKNIDKLTPELQTYYTFKRTILKELFKDIAGNVVLALSNVEQGAESIYEYTYNKLTESLFVFNEQGISTLDILKVIFVFILGFMLAALYKRKIMNLATREKLSYSSAKIISGAGYYILVFITLLVALKSIGLDLSNLGLMAGALSIGIGFGLQTVVSNLAAGIILMFERTIRIGDYIEVTDTIRGTVSDMKMRSTTITTNDNIDVIIPNSSFIQNNVINWTLENDIRRIHIPFSVAYGTPNEKVEEVILSELKASNINYISKPPKYTTLIWMTGMGASSVDYELVVWIKGQSTLKPAGTKSDFLKFIYAALNKHHIQIPFPQLDLHIKKNEENEEKDPV
jgi:potassium-dependent mechanosensitive channel